MGSDVWTWRYRRGAFDTREQKRLVVSPHGDGGEMLHAYAQSWVYSLTGVAGEELVLYKGIQTTKTAVVWPLNNGQTDQGRRVYMAMSRFFVAGTELQYLANGYKELHITDNQGNVRTIFQLGYNSPIRSFDYKPFGEKEWTSVAEDHDRKGFAGSEYDSESDYYAMGYRMYSAEFGRFMAVDPLFEAMPRHNPYHYSYNSPMFWSDPSGLVPVKEKVKNSERLQQVELDWARINEDNEAWAAIASTIDQIHMSNYQNATTTSKKGIFSNFGVNPINGFGISSGGSRIGIVGAGYNGAYQTMELNVPANWDTKSLDKSTEPANKHLRELQKTTVNEVGYLLRYDKNADKLYADFFIGKADDTWLGMKESPYDNPLKDSEMIVGFTHTHPGGQDHFGPDDLAVISKLSLGEYSWTNVPKMAKFTIERGWGFQKITNVEVLHNSSKTIDRMYFGLIHPKGYDSFSWKLVNKANLSETYIKIYSVRGAYPDFLQTPSLYQAQFNYKRKSK